MWMVGAGWGVRSQPNKSITDFSKIQKTIFICSTSTYKNEFCVFYTKVNKIDAISPIENSGASGPSVRAHPPLKYWPVCVCVCVCVEPLIYLCVLVAAHL